MDTTEEPHVVICDFCLLATPKACGSSDEITRCDKPFYAARAMTPDDVHTFIKHAAPKIEVARSASGGDTGGYPDDNPKTAFGEKKAPLHLIPATATIEEARAFKLGADKYGPFNWRDNRVSSTVYVGAIRRHLDSWFDGEDIDPESLANHLGHIRACCGILLDAMHNGMLNDDRPTPAVTADIHRSFQSITDARKSQENCGE